MIKILCLEDHEACHRQLSFHKGVVFALNNSSLRIADLHWLPCTSYSRPAFSQLLIVRMRMIVDLS